MHSKWFLSTCLKCQFRFLTTSLNEKFSKQYQQKTGPQTTLVPNRILEFVWGHMWARTYSHQAKVGKKTKEEQAKKEQTSKKIFAFASASSFIPYERTFIVVLVVMFTNIYCRNPAKVVSVVIYYSNKSSIVVRSPAFRAYLDDAWETTNH